MEPLTLFLVIIFGIFVGIISVTVGGASLISIPFLMAIGLNPYAAIATNKLSIIGSFVAGGIKYHQKGVMKYKKLAVFFSIAALLGSFIGANLVLRINEQILKIVIIILLILVLFVTTIKNKLGMKPQKIEFTKQRYLVSFIIVFILGIYSGFFGAGFGTFIIFSLVFFFGLTLLESAALMTIINLFVLIIPIIVFALNKVIDYSIGIPLMFSVALGGWIGAHFAVLKGNVLIKALFIIVTVGLIIKLIFSL